MMKTVLDKLFGKMKLSKGLPALSSTVANVLSNLNSENLQEVVLDITSDFALTQQVLQMANGAMYAPFAKNIPSVSKALQVLGTDAIRSIVLSVPLVSNFEDPNDAELAKSSVTSILARSLTSDRKEAFSIAAMFYNLGTVIASKYLPEETSAVLDLSTRIGVEDAAKTVFGYTFPEIGEAVSRFWNLPVELETIVNRSSKDSLLVIAAFSAKVVEHIQNDNKSSIEALAKTLNVDGVCIDTANVLTLVEDLIRSQPLIFRKASYQTKIEELLWSVCCSTITSDQTLAETIFPKLSSILKTSNCIYAKLDCTNHISACFVFGENKYDLLEHFRIPAAFQPTAFGIAIRKNVDLALLDVARLRSGTLPNEFLRLVPKLVSVLILPVVNSSETGLIVYTWQHPVKFTDTEFELLKAFRDQFIKVVNRKGA